jgi:hypothetical protein
MTKADAIQRMVNEFNAIPQSWVRIVAENDNDYRTFPMWGTMWIVDSFYGEKLLENSRVMVFDKDEIDLESLDEAEREKVEKAIQEDDFYVLEEYVDEEMSGERCVLDNNGNTTALYIYEVSDEYVIGVNGAGWNFFDGVWDKLYDIMGLKWHEEGTE